MAPYREEEENNDGGSGFSLAEITGSIGQLFGMSSSDRIDTYDYDGSSGPKTKFFVPLCVFMGSTLGNRYYLGNEWKTSSLMGGINAGISFLSHQILNMRDIKDLIGNGMLFESGLNGAGTWLLSRNGKREYISDRDLYYDIGFSAGSTLAGLYLEKSLY